MEINYNQYNDLSEILTKIYPKAVYLFNSFCKEKIRHVKNIELKTSERLNKIHDKVISWADMTRKIYFLKSLVYEML